MHSLDSLTSGVTRVGVTRGGNWWCHPYKKLMLFFSHLLWRVMIFKLSFPYQLGNGYHPLGVTLDWNNFLWLNLQKKNIKFSDATVFDLDWTGIHVGCILHPCGMHPASMWDASCTHVGCIVPHPTSLLSVVDCCLCLFPAESHSISVCHDPYYHLCLPVGLSTSLRSQWKLTLPATTCNVPDDVLNHRRLAHRSVLLLSRYSTTYSSRIFIMSPPLTYLQKWRQVL